MRDVTNIARIIYISLTVLTALVFAFSDVAGTRTESTLWLFCVVGSSALCAGWLSWHWLHPVTWGGYLLCALLCVVLFHIGIAVGAALDYFIVGIRSMDMNIFVAGFLIAFGALVITLAKVGLYTLWLCLQTALITKGVVWIIGRCNQ